MSSKEKDESQPDWLTKTVGLCEKPAWNLTPVESLEHTSLNLLIAKVLPFCKEHGLRCTPVYENGKTKPYGSGQTYYDIRDYKGAVHLAIVLDDYILIDYDGNKLAPGDSIIPVENLAKELGVEEIPLPVQVNTEGNSIHYIVKRNGTKVDRASNDGKAFKHVDFKTGNQLMHIKAGKTLNLERFLNAPLATPEILALFNRDSKCARLAEPLPLSMRRSNLSDLESYPSSGTKGEAVLNKAVAAIEAAKEGTRNSTLNREAFKVFGCVLERELDKGVALAGVVRAAQTAGLDKEEIRNTMLSAWNGAEQRREYSPLATEVKGYAQSLIQGIQTEVADVAKPASAHDRLQFTHLKRSQNGHCRPLPTRENLMDLMEWHGIKVSFDVYQKIVKCEGVSSSIGDDENAVISTLKSLCGQHELNQSVVMDHLSYVAQMDPVNEPLAWLESLPAPKLGVDPFQQLVETGCFPNKKFAYVAIKRWFIQTVAAADAAQQTPNKRAKPKYESVLVFMGMQGARKTSFIQDLLPHDLHKCFVEGRSLDLKNKDSILDALRGWITELGELDATFKKSDISALKAFLSNQVDSIRLPYAKAAGQWRRQTSFIASVNEKRFLRDSTGNRRYLPLEITDKLILPDDFDSTNLWAYAWDLYKKGEQWWLTEEEEKLHKLALAEFEQLDPITEMILDHYDFDDWDGVKGVKRTPSQIAVELGIPKDRGNTTKIGTALAKLGVVKIRRNYLMPPARTPLNGVVSFAKEDSSE